MVRTIAPACLAALAAAPAYAECVFPDGVRESPRRAAQLLLDHADHVGFGVVRRRADPASERAEEIEILFPFKGPAGRVQMDMPVENGIFWATANLISFDEPEGTVVFAVLRRQAGGAVIGECTQQLLIRPGRDGIIAALFEMWAQGELRVAR